MEKKVNKFLLWLPRILSIAFIAFLSLFSLDVFEPGLKWWEILLGLFMHNIPVFVLIVVLIIAWKHEIVGAIAFGLAGLLYVYLTAGRAQFPTALSWSMIIAGPAFVIGFLFMHNWCEKRSNRNKRPSATGH
jgi:hypothetical protein